jgi:putative transposase
MPWRSKTNVDIRKEAVKRVKAGETVAGVARDCGVSRKTLYKFIEREKRLEGLQDRSRAPMRQWKKTDIEIERVILRLRRTYGWGAKKILVIAQRKYPQMKFPARSTIEQIFRRHGLIAPTRKRVVGAEITPASKLTPALGPNDVWTIDYKGHFKTQDKKYCYPLTICDLYSRKILALISMPRITWQEALAICLELFGRYGLPRVIRSDNGSPFATNWSSTGLTRLSAQWVARGIHHERIDPGRPQQNGVHERMHGSLISRYGGIKICSNVFTQQQEFDRFSSRFNKVRPHEGIGMKTPNELYKSSPRKDKGPQTQYPLCTHSARVDASGHIDIPAVGKARISISLMGLRVGFSVLRDDVIDVYFAHIHIGEVPLRASHLRTLEQRKLSSDSMASKSLPFKIL